MRVVSGQDWFNTFWGDDQVPKNKEYPFGLRVAVAGYRVTPRHRTFEFLLDMGHMYLEAVLKHQPLGLTKKGSLFFVFPERWLSVHEQRNFLSRLGSHPDAGMISRVDVVTQNALIVGSVPKGCLRMFDFRGDAGDPETGGVGLLDGEMSKSA